MRSRYEPGIVRRQMAEHGYVVDTLSNSGYFIINLQRAPFDNPGLETVKIVVRIKDDFIHVYPLPSPLLELHEDRVNGYGLGDLCFRIWGAHLFTDLTVSQISSACADDILTRLAPFVKEKQSWVGHVNSTATLRP